MNEHVSNTICGCAPILHALHILRAHGMCDTALNTVYQAVVIAKLTYAASAWCGFTNSADRQRIEAFARRSVRWGFCRSDSPTIEQLVNDADQSLFSRVLKNEHHVLHPLIPDERHNVYDLRTRSHNRELNITSRLMDCNFLIRLLYKDTYWHDNHITFIIVFNFLTISSIHSFISSSF